MREASAARLCSLNAGIHLVWGAVLGLSLQSRTIALDARGGGLAAYAEIFALGAAVATVVQIAAGAFSDRVHRERGSRSAFYAIGTAVSVPALLWFYAAGNLVQLAIAFVLLEIGMNVLGGPYQAVIADYVTLERRGVAAAWMSAYQSLGNAAGLIIAGFVHDLRLVAVALAAPLAAAYGVTATSLRDVRPLDVATAPAAGIAAQLRGPLGALLFSRGLINVGFFTLLGFLLFFVRDALGVRGDATITQTGILFLVFTASAVPGAIAAARPADRYDKRRVVSAAMALVVVALAGLCRAASLPEALVCGAVAGAGWGAFVTADWALASAVLPGGAMATTMGVWNIATTLPQVVAPLATLPLVTYLDARAPGLGPRGAIALALLEFALGGAAVWRLPRA